MFFILDGVQFFSIGTEISKHFTSKEKISPFNNSKKEFETIIAYGYAQLGQRYFAKSTDRAFIDVTVNISDQYYDRTNSIVISRTPFNFYDKKARINLDLSLRFGKTFHKNKSLYAGVSMPKISFIHSEEDLTASGKVHLGCEFCVARYASIFCEAAYKLYLSREPYENLTTHSASISLGLRIHGENYYNPEG
ncbi:MAG: hypothetical protein H6850_00540 [Alphaproteobacteria bacterium]|nr:MAG: hypothetical protein H6850_00540 [Alphaproteobacteria bacterium]